MTYLCRHRRNAKVYLQHIHKTALEGGGWSAPRFGRFTLRKKLGTSCTRGWVTLGDGLGYTENLACIGFDSRTFQSMAILYTAIAVLAVNVQKTFTF